MKPLAQTNTPFFLQSSKVQIFHSKAKQIVIFMQDEHHLDKRNKDAPFAESTLFTAFGKYYRVP